MLEKIENLPAGIDGVRATGRVSKEDYSAVFAPLIEDARREGRRIRLLYYFGPEFEGLTAAAAWEDAKIGLRSMRLFEGCAIVSDIGWLRESSRVAGFFMPCPVRVFSTRDKEAAASWLESLPQGAGVSARLIPESGVLVAEVNEPLRSQDFDGLASMADLWLATHDQLSGLVIHAREFPGWEKLDSFLRHVNFVRNHHEHIEKVALCSDSKLASLAPQLAEHFAAAKIKGFGYDQLEDAIAWAEGAQPPAHAPPSPSAVETRH